MRKASLHKIEKMLFAAVIALLVAVLILSAASHNTMNKSRPDDDYTVIEDVKYEQIENAGTQSLCRMTWKRLVAALESAGVGDIIATSEKRRYLKTEQVDCDLYRILAGDKQATRKYNGEYLKEYEWAEERNAQLHWMLKDNSVI